MDYSEAIEYLRVNGITKEDGTFYEFGEVIFLLFRFLRYTLLGQERRRT